LWYKAKQSTSLYLEEVVLWEMHLGSKLTNSLIYSRYPARSTLLTEKGGRENMNSHMYNMEYLHTLKKECITWNTFTHSNRKYNME
jgi:hypothetical protein